MWGRRRAEADAADEALANLADHLADVLTLLGSIDTTARDIRDSLDRLADRVTPA
jgi:hypothetical protein